MSELIYDLKGCRGRKMKVYEDKVVITVKPGIGSFLTGNALDGEKTIYFSDCLGVQFKKCGLTIGYLQFETASGIMNNKKSNHFNENTFTWEKAYVEEDLTNEKMEEVTNYVKDRIDYYKQARNAPVAAAAPATPADEIKKYKELLDMGVLTQEEFDAKKKQLLGL